MAREGRPCRYVVLDAEDALVIMERKPDDSRVVKVIYPSVRELTDAVYEAESHAGAMRRALNKYRKEQKQ